MEKTNSDLHTIKAKSNMIRILNLRYSLAVQWLGLSVSTAAGMGSIIGWGSKIPCVIQVGKKKNPTQLKFESVNNLTQKP